MIAPFDDPARFGGWWIWPDGTRLPVVSGGSDDGDPDSGAEDVDDSGDDDPDNGAAATENTGSDAEIRKWKAMARKHEAKAKANAEAAQRLKEMEHAGKSETEKLQALLEEQQVQARSATVKALKLQVAADKGLPATLAKFLPDLDDEVDMLAAADELLEASGAAGKATQPTRQTPKSTLTNPLGDDDPAAQREAIVNSMLGRSVS